MKNAKQAIALASAAALSLSMLAGCGSSASSAASSEATSTATAEATTSTSDGTLVLAETGFEGKFSPFFAASASDQDVIDLWALYWEELVIFRRLLDLHCFVMWLPEVKVLLYLHCHTSTLLRKYFFVRLSL